MNAVIRCDDDQHGTHMEGNVCCRTGGHGEGFISKGDNDMVNNVVADLRPTHRHRGYIVFPYGSIEGSTIRRNVLYSRRKGQVLYHEGRSRRGGRPPRLRDTDADGNLYYCTEDPDWAAEHLATERAFGIEEHSLAADPRLVDVDGGDFRFRPGSPAEKLGIEPLDVSRAGLQAPYRERFVGRRITTRIAPADQTLREPIRVTVTCDQPGATIRYTLDGTEPDGRSTRYDGPFLLHQPATVRAKAFAEGATDLVGAVAVFAAPPAPILEDFESVPPGAETPEATTQEDAKRSQYTARVTDQQAADGRQSLKFVDGPGQAQSWTPHVYWRRRYTEGEMIGRFDVRVDASASLSYQWRHYEGGYRQGPVVAIEPGGVVVHDGKPLLRIPIGQWVRFEVRSPIGDASTGRFTLSVRLPGARSPQVFENLPCPEAFTRLDWIGLVAKAREEAVFYIDNVEVRASE
jgi:hypothetical protein